MRAAEGPIKENTTMKAGRPIAELAAEIKRQTESKRDFKADTRQLELMRLMGTDRHRYELRVNGHGQFEASDLLHEQIGARLAIPKQYYDRMSQVAPELLIRNVNHWLVSNPERRMVRTLDGRARAFLSERYRPLDNYDLANAVLGKIADIGAEVHSAELTERRLYIKAIFPKIQAEVRVGDVVQSGVVISNSEVGCGSVRVEPLVFRLSCLNGMIAADSSIRKYHVGRSGDGSVPTQRTSGCSSPTATSGSSATR